jgi:hypothetical protein
MRVGIFSVFYECVVLPCYLVQTFDFFTYMYVVYVVSCVAILLLPAMGCCGFLFKGCVSTNCIMSWWVCLLGSCDVLRGLCERGRGGVLFGYVLLF